MKYVFDIDDLCDDYDPMDQLLALKDEYPGLKVTVFAIPGRCCTDLLADYRKLDWVEVGVHGYWHASMECATWSEDETDSKLQELEENGWAKLFKAPGWQMSPGLYRSLADRGWVVAEHSAYSSFMCPGLSMARYCYNLPQNIEASVHGHTWETMGNGPDSWGNLFAAIPANAEFQFVSEAATEWAWDWDFDQATQDAESSWSSESDWGQASAGRCYQMFTDSVKPLAGDSFVDFGSNDGFVAGYMRNMGAFTDVWGVEPEPARARECDLKGVKTICTTLEGIGNLVGSGVWDWGYCSHTLEHCEDLRLAVDNIRATVRKGIVITVPIESRESFDDNLAHLQWMTRDEWVEFLGIEVLAESDNELTGVWRK